MKARMEKLGPWYHDIDLGDGLRTGGWDGVKPQWDNVRSVRAGMDYSGKHVLDIGSRDGMWAFEAEELGASAVVATDIGDLSFLEHILFARFCRKSRVAVYWNVSVEDLSRLDCYFRFGGKPVGDFDIVQHLGVLYHLENPIRSLRECRSVMKTGGTLLLETAVCRDDSAPLARFNSDSGVYKDVNTFWAFNRAALLGALNQNGFVLTSPLTATVPHNEDIERLCLTAEAV